MWIRSGLRRCGGRLGIRNRVGHDVRTLEVAHSDHQTDHAARTCRRNRDVDLGARCERLQRARLRPTDAQQAGWIGQQLAGPMHHGALLVGDVEENLRMRVGVVEARDDDFARPLLVTVVGNERAVMRECGQRYRREQCANESARQRCAFHDASAVKRCPNPWSAPSLWEMKLAYTGYRSPRYLLRRRVLILSHGLRDVGYPRPEPDVRG